MGQEFCQGCRDCTNNNPEEDFSRKQNPPLTNINNPFFFNNKTSNSVNDVTQMNNESFLNNYNHNKNESFVTTNNLPEFEENAKLRSKNNNLNEKERQNEFKRKRSIRIIKNFFKKIKKMKNDSHQILVKEVSSIPSSQYILDLNNEDLDVNLAPENSCLYLGTKFKNIKDGLGLEIFDVTKSKYFGIFRNGKRFQVGQFSMNNDLKEYYFNGQIIGIYACGYGWFQDKKNFIYYEGYWKNSMKNGYGIEICEDNSEYRGTFLNGKKEGLGYYKWEDGSSYEGEWKKNKLNGYGIYTFKDHSIYRGEWRGNRMDGLGEFISPQREKIYIGYFKRDLRNGFGMVIWPETKRAFIGFWKNNQQEGIGKFFANNKIRYGIWREGICIQKINSKEEFYNKINEQERKYYYYLYIEQYDNIAQLFFQSLGSNYLF